MNYDFSLEPTKSIDYLKNKGYNLTFDYDEMMHEAHHRAFTVAKVTRLDLLTDIHTSLIDSMKSGKPFEEWKKELIPTLKKYGWYGQITVKDPKTDREKDIYVGSRRLKTIFDTNMRVSYATSRYNEQINSDSEYWRYSAILDGRTRERHRLMHGITLHRDHDFWRTNYPPNGWRCRCKVRAFTKSEVDSRNIIVSDEPPYTTIADKDWGYDVGNSKLALETVYYQKALKNILNCKENNAKTSINCDFSRTIFSNAIKDIQDNVNIAYIQNQFITPIYSQFKEQLGKSEKDRDFTWLKNFPKSVVIGAIDLIVFDFLKSKNIIVENPHIYLTSERLRHSIREDKAHELTLEELLQVPKALLSANEIYFDKTKKNILYVFDRIEDKAKIAIEVPYKKTGLNEIVTMMGGPKEALKSGAYEKIK